MYEPSLVSLESMVLHPEFVLAPLHQYSLTLLMLPVLFHAMVHEEPTRQPLGADTEMDCGGATGRHTYVFARGV